MQAKPETIPGPATPESAYAELSQIMLDRLPPHHERLCYLPSRDHAGLDSSGQKIHTLSPDELDMQLATTNAIINLGRYAQPNPDYEDTSVTRPDRNIVLAAPAKANVEKAADLYFRARAGGNQDIRLITTAWAHARELNTLFSLPWLARTIGIDPRLLMEQGIRPQDVAAKLDEARFLEPERTYHAQDYLGHSAVSVRIQQDYAAFAEQFSSFPQISESRLQAEYAAELAVPAEAIIAEERSVETITAFLSAIDLLEKASPGTAKRVAITATRDHMPRVVWLADHMFPDNYEIVCAESELQIGREEYAASCEREKNSLLASINWIGGSRDLETIRAITNKGYFHNIKSPTQLENIVQQTGSKICTKIPRYYRHTQPENVGLPIFIASESGKSKIPYAYAGRGDAPLSSNRITWGGVLKAVR